MIDRARNRTEPSESVEYIVLDATDEEALVSLVQNSFQAILCDMTLFDSAALAPFYRTVSAIL